MSSSSQQAQPKSTIKDDTALNEISINFTSFLQGFMRDCGYDFDETEVFSCAFLSFMCNTLFYLSQLLISLKSSINHEMNEEEKTCLNNVEFHHSSPEMNCKMDEAMQVMKTELPQKIKRCMLDSGFDQFETKDSHSSYVSIISRTLLSETGKMSRLKERFKYSGQSNNNVLQNQSGSNDPHRQLECYPSNGSKTSAISSPHVKEVSSLDPISMKLIGATSKHNIYHVLSENIVMKVLKAHKSTSKNIIKLDNELDFNKIFVHPSIRRTLKRSVFKNEEALLLEWAPGVPLSRMESFSIKEFLTLAREIMCPLLQIHMNSLMHMNLSCDHIIFNNESKSIKIISCGSCTTFSNNRNFLSKQEIVEKDLRFISPEQTGRINRYVDHRSDFYSLGIIFYKLLTAIYPFESENKINLLHKQISDDPVPVCAIDSSIPKIVSDMISKLMAKNAEDRYQTTKGIVHDLDLMISEYDNDDKLSSIVLAQHDKSEILMLPQKLYGRSADYNALLAAFGRISKSFELVMVSGDSGAGKTALVSELYKVVAQKDGIFINGKYHFSKSEPYSAFLTAFNNFCDDLLLKDKLTIVNCKSRIQDAVGQEGEILTSLITNLHSIIGEQPSVSDAVGQVAKNRFHYVFVKLIKAICSAGFPIVLVLEDLQWIDVESLSLLSTLVADKSMKNIMLVGTYRENEVNNTHPVKLFINDLENSFNTLTEIKLNNFHHETLNEFISDALCIPFHEAYTLTAIFMEKTKGNPFFVHQMIRSLSEKGLILFNNDTRKWGWDPTIYEGNDISKSVLELLRLNILALDENTQQVLKVASCIGSSFSLQTLKLIVNRSEAIERALSTGMITQQNGSDRVYRFVHDQTQMAAFSLLPENPTRMFFYIGKKLWTLYSQTELNENIFLVIHLLHNARDLILDQTERSKVAELFLIAGNKAITSTAFTQAYEYLEAGMKLLGADCWKFNYDLSLNLHNSTAKASYCISNFTSLRDCMEAVLKNASSVLHTVQVHALKIKYYNDKRKFQDALDTAICILDKIGENTNYSQSEEMYNLEVAKAKSHWYGKSHQEILELKEMEDECKVAAMSILFDILPCLHFINPHLYFCVSLRMVNLTLEYGVSKFSTLGFSSLGAALCNKDSNYCDAFPYQLGEIALILLKNTSTKEFAPWVITSFYALVSPFYAHIHDSIEPFLDAYKINLEIGSYHGATISASSHCTYSFLSGKNLEKTKNYIDEFDDMLPMKIKPYLAIHQAILNLLGENDRNPALLSGQVFDYENIDNCTVPGCDGGRILVYCGMVAYFFHDYFSCLKFFKSIKPFIEMISNVYHYPILLFFEGLVSLAVAKLVEDEEQCIAIASKNIAKLKIMSNNAPENYSNKVAILEAELAVVRGDRQKAKKFFTEAISLSRKYGFINEEALAFEREGLFLLETNSLDGAKLSLNSSYHCYEKWGAKALSTALVKNHPAITFSIDRSVNLQVNDHSECSVSLLTEISSTSNLKRKRVTFEL